MATEDDFTADEIMTRISELSPTDKVAAYRIVCRVEDNDPELMELYEAGDIEGLRAYANKIVEEVRAES